MLKPLTRISKMSDRVFAKKSTEISKNNSETKILEVMRQRLTSTKVMERKV